MTGNELKPTEIINGAGGPGGPTEIRYRAHVAFSTMEEALKNLEEVHNRRKALVWVSDGYDFAPFKDARYGTMDPNSPFEQNQSALARNQAAASQNGGQAVDPNSDPDIRQQQQQEQFADADLSRELYEITQAANRANTTIYTIDPRGLVGPLPDLDENVDPQQWSEFVRKSQDSLRTLAEETGGIAVVNTNDFTKALKRSRRRDERLLRAGVLLEEPGHPEAPPDGRRPGDEAGLVGLGAERVRAEAVAAPALRYEAAVAFRTFSSPRRALAGRLSAAARSRTASRVRATASDR